MRRFEMYAVVDLLTGKVIAKASNNGKKPPVRFTLEFWDEVLEEQGKADEPVFKREVALSSTLGNMNKISSLPMHHWVQYIDGSWRLHHENIDVVKQQLGED